MSDRLLSLITRKSVQDLNALMASPGGPEVVDRARQVVGRFARRHSDDVRSVAAVIFASWPGLTSGDMAHRLSSADAASVAAVRRAVAADFAGRPEEIAADDETLATAADTAAYCGHNDPAPAPDAFTATTMRDALRDVITDVLPSVLLPLADFRHGVPHGPLTQRQAKVAAPLSVLRAVAAPDDSQKDAALINRAAVLRAMGARTKGTGGQTDRARLEESLATLTATGVHTLAAHAMVTPRPVTPITVNVDTMIVKAVTTAPRTLPGMVLTRSCRPAPGCEGPSGPLGRSWSHVTLAPETHVLTLALPATYRARKFHPGKRAVVRHADRMIRPGGACHIGQAIWHRGQPIVGPVGPVVSTSPGRYGHNQGAKWVTLDDRSILVTADVATAILTGQAWSTPDTVGEVIPFTAPDTRTPESPDGAFLASAVAVKGVRPGTPHGAAGARAGQGKPFVKIASSKRRRDGGIGSPMI